MADLAAASLLSPPAEDTLLAVRSLRKYFPVKASAFSGRTLTLKAVDGVSFDLKRGETLGLVGESGCGKTTVGRSILRLYEPDGGRVFLDPQREPVTELLELDTRISEMEATGERPAELAELQRRAAALARRHDLLSMNNDGLRRARQRMQIVFQDPWASLNPRMIVEDIIAEGPREFGTHSRSEVDHWVRELLDRVGLPRAAAERYPHEFSGGQRQRIGIARALALNPSVIICDEPVSALDVSIQAQVLNLLISLQDEFDLTYVFIAHDLSVVQYISDRVAVMYLGKIAEISPADELYRSPRHPYTRFLLSAVPVADPDYQQSDVILEGSVPSPIDPPAGCSFHPRCPYATDECRAAPPPLDADESGTPDHVFACYNPPSD